MRGRDLAAVPSIAEAHRAYLVAHQQTLKAAFVAGDAAPLNAVLSRLLRIDAAVVFDAARGLHRASFALTLADDRAVFVFAPPEPDAVSIMTFERWWGIVPLIERLVAVERSEPVAVMFNMNDEGADPGLAFCDARAAFSLIPDSNFIGTRGYEDQRLHYARNAVPWEARSERVFWRGSSTGRQLGSVLDLPRVALCRLCKDDPDGLFDVGLTLIADRCPEDARLIEEMGIMAPFVPWPDFDRYRFHIDIDGHTNSWPGLMMKLHSGGLVFKVEPPHGHRQWYYERLRPWENYVPVRSDLGDLFELAAYFRRNAALARRIAEEGRRLALAMTCEAELDVGVRTVLARSARDRFEAERRPLSAESGGSR